MIPRPTNDLAGTVAAPRRDAASTAAERLTWRLSDVAKALGVSRRTIERERSAGRFPPPDLHIGKAPLWRPQTIREWVERGGIQ